MAKNSGFVLIIMLLLFERNSCYKRVLVPQHGSSCHARSSSGGRMPIFWRRRATASRELWGSINIQTKSSEFGLLWVSTFLTTNLSDPRISNRNAITNNRKRHFRELGITNRVRLNVLAKQYSVGYLSCFFSTFYIGHLELVYVSALRIRLSDLASGQSPWCLE
jgi:hypothetical protein